MWDGLMHGNRKWRASGRRGGECVCEFRMERVRRRHKSGPTACTCRSPIGRGHAWQPRTGTPRHPTGLPPASTPQPCPHFVRGKRALHCCTLPPPIGHCENTQPVSRPQTDTPHTARRPRVRQCTHRRHCRETHNAAEPPGGDNFVNARAVAKEGGAIQPVASCSAENTLTCSQVKRFFKAVRYHIATSCNLLDPAALETEAQISMSHSANRAR